MGLAVLAGAIWFFRAGPSDRVCGDQITVTIDVGEAEFDALRSITFQQDGSPMTALDDSTMPGLLNC